MEVLGGKLDAGLEGAGDDEVEPQLLNPLAEFF
jgi:hypothetical protein